MSKYEMIYMLHPGVRVSRTQRNRKTHTVYTQGSEQARVEHEEIGKCIHAMPRNKSEQEQTLEK